MAHFDGSRSNARARHRWATRPLTACAETLAVTAAAQPQPLPLDGDVLQIDERTRTIRWVPFSTGTAVRGPAD
jgi:hypothetical protein